MPSYTLKLYRNDGAVSVEAEAIPIEAVSDDEAVVRASQVERPLIDDIDLLALFAADGDLVWATAPGIYSATI